MAQIQPLFDTIISGTGTVGTETWVDLGLIPAGKQIWIGYATYGATDKNLQFETRTNLATKSTGTTANTTVQDFCGAQAGSSTDRDFYFDGNVNTLSVVSTGVEHWWLRVMGQGATQGGFEYIIRYTTF